MLFFFPESAKAAFWMKNVKFPIDIIWIENNKVVGIEKNVQPQPGVADSDLALYYSPGLIRHVLEVNAGFSDSNGIENGDEVVIPSDL